MSWRRINSAATLGINAHAIYESHENIITVKPSVIMLNVVVVTVVAPNKQKFPQHAVSFYSSVIYNCKFLIASATATIFPRKKKLCKKNFGDSFLFKLQDDQPNNYNFSLSPAP
jgi:hypothetical protein